jgi:hypothetical protein
VCPNCDGTRIGPSSSSADTLIIRSSGAGDR